MTKLETATVSNSRGSHKVTLEGKPFEVANFSPVAMARSIRRRKTPKISTIAEKKARLEAIARQRGI